MATTKIQVPAVIERMRDAVMAPSADILTRIRALVKKKVAAEKHKAHLEAELAKVNAELATIDRESLPELMRMAQTTSHTFDDGLWTISLSPNVQASLPKDPEKRKEAFAWLTKNKHGGLIKSELSISFSAGDIAKAQKLAAKLMKEGLDVQFEQTIHPQTLKAWVRERLKVGAAIPSAIEYIDVSTAVVKVDKDRLREKQARLSAPPF